MSGISDSGPSFYCVQVGNLSVPTTGFEFNGYVSSKTLNSYTSKLLQIGTPIKKVDANDPNLHITTNYVDCVIKQDVVRFSKANWFTASTILRELESKYTVKKKYKD